MKIILKLMMVVLGIFIFTGCNSSNNSIKSIKHLEYKGKTVASDFTLEDVKAFRESMEVFSLQDVYDFEYISDEEMALIKESKKKVQGKYGGSMLIRIENKDSLILKITSVFENYNEDGNILNGKLIISQKANAMGNRTDFSNYHIKNKKDEIDIIIDGSIVSRIDDQYNNLITQNIVVKNNLMDEMIQYEDMKILVNPEGAYLSYNGRLYYSEEGYIDIDTSKELRYDDDDVLIGGEIIYTGQNVIATEKILAQNMIHLEIDTDADGSIDEIEVFDARSKKVIPNRAPVVEVEFPKYIYTDTKVSQINVTITDPDFDTLDTRYTWSINGKVVSDTMTLDSDLFKKHDRLKLIVKVTDHRLDMSKTTTITKEQEVLNSKPVIHATFEYGSFEVDESSKLVYTITDADGDEVSYAWRHYTDKYLETQRMCETEILIYEEEQENIYSESCKDVDGEAFRVDTVFVKDNLFTALRAGVYDHELVVTDGDLNESKILLESTISNMDLFEEYIDTEEETAFTIDTYNVEIEDIDANGEKDLIYIGSITREEDREEPILVIEYRENASLSKKVSYPINSTNLSAFYVNDYNGDGRLDILFAYQDTASNFELMLQNETGTLDDAIVIRLPENDALAMADMTGDGTTDIVMVSKKDNKTLDVKIFDEENIVTLPLSLPSMLNKKIVIHDMDDNDKKDLFVFNKNKMDDKGTLRLDGSLFSQDTQGDFSETVYSLVLEEHLEVADQIEDIRISDFDAQKDLVIVSTTEHLYLLKLEDKHLKLIKKIDYLKKKENNTVKLLESSDVTGDGKKELIIVNASEEMEITVTLLVQKENLSFAPVQDYDYSLSSMSITIPSAKLGDLEDGKYKIYFSKGDKKPSILSFK